MALGPIKARCYGERMLNPFHGVVDVVEIQGADAVSRDGLHWTLYVQSDPEEALVDGRVQELEVPDVKFGTWSAAEGLRRGPIRNASDYPFVDLIGGQLLQAVKQYCNDVPFALCDRYELWMLDQAGEPLALLASACNESTLRQPYPRKWHAGERAKRTFRAANREAWDMPHSELVAALVNGEAGPHERLQWFERREDGSGLGLHGLRLYPAEPGRRLPRDAFPELMVRECWPSSEDSRLVRDFLEWQASWLLQLQNLSEPTRARLEEVAAGRATEMAERHRLYPQVLDEVRVTAALVEARMRRALTPDSPEEKGPAETLHPFFNE